VNFLRNGCALFLSPPGRDRETSLRLFVKP